MLKKGKQGLEGQGMSLRFCTDLSGNSNGGSSELGGSCNSKHVLRNSKQNVKF